MIASETLEKGTKIYKVFCQTPSGLPAAWQLNSPTH